MNLSLTTMWSPIPDEQPLIYHIENILTSDYPNAQARLLSNLITVLNLTDEQITAVFAYTSTSKVHGWAKEQ